MIIIKRLTILSLFFCSTFIMSSAFAWHSVVGTGDYCSGAIGLSDEENGCTGGGPHGVFTCSSGHTIKERTCLLHNRLSAVENLLASIQGSFNELSGSMKN